MVSAPTDQQVRWILWREMKRAHDRGLPGVLTQCSCKSRCGFLRSENLLFSPLAMLKMPPRCFSARYFLQPVRTALSNSLSQPMSNN